MESASVMTPSKHIYVLYSVKDKKARSVINFDFEEQANDPYWLKANEELAWLKLPKKDVLTLRDVAEIQQEANNILSMQ